MLCDSIFLFFSFTLLPPHCSLLFFFNDPAPTEIYTLSLHDALPISKWLTQPDNPLTARVMVNRIWKHHLDRKSTRLNSSHVSISYAVFCLKKKKKKKKKIEDSEM